jgi:hypothetical protein
VKLPLFIKNSADRSIFKIYQGSDLHGQKSAHAKSSGLYRPNDSKAPFKSGGAKARKPGNFFQETGLKKARIKEQLLPT